MDHYMDHDNVHSRPNIDEPVRMCVICRRKFAKSGLNRHVLGQNGELIADGRKLLPGRGWYCCSDPKCVIRFAMFRPKQKRAAHSGRQGR